MSASRPVLTFLYPFLFAPSVGRARVAQGAPGTIRRDVHSSRRSRGPAAQRYGTANEPPPHLNRPEKKAGSVGGQQKKVEASGTTKATSPPYSASAPSTDAKIEGPSKCEQKEQESKSTPSPAPEATSEPAGVPQAAVLDATESIPLRAPPPSPQMPAEKPLETVLNMPPPEMSDLGQVYSDSIAAKEQVALDAQKALHNKGFTESSQTGEVGGQRPPHISTPPYVHHFDTYSLVKRLEGGGWTQAQSITLMKAVRLILSDNMELARKGLVSKSNVENETYLFKAACSELRTEINTKRRAEAERSRTERTQLQHEVDILGQRVGQEAGTLKDDLKGMFDDRKMTVRNEQRDMQSKLQELNYRITVALNSDSRSDVEGVRWIITKRAITALAICVAMILGSLKFASSVATWEEDEKKRINAVRERLEQENNSPKSSKRGGGGGGGGGNGGNGNGEGGQSSKGELLMDEMGKGEILVQQGDNPAFVSLG